MFPEQMPSCFSLIDRHTTSQMHLKCASHSPWIWGSCSLRTLWFLTGCAFVWNAGLFSILFFLGLTPVLPSSDLSICMTARQQDSERLFQAPPGKKCSDQGFLSCWTGKQKISSCPVRFLFLHLEYIIWILKQGSCTHTLIYTQAQTHT